MELKKIEIKRISDLTDKQKQSIIDRHGQILFDKHQKYNALVEVKTHEEIVPFCGTYSNRLHEIVKKDGLENVRVQERYLKKETLKDTPSHIETIEFAEETRDLLEHRPDIKISPDVKKKLDDIKDGYLLLKKWRIDKGTEIFDIIELTDDYFEKIIW